ncbi:MAG: aminotransferase class III-fold pyridoxal phosphate-dependent enzyme, partial [Pseudomonadota bacterium]
ERPEDLDRAAPAAGHPTTCATAVAAVESLAEQDLITRTRTETGPHFLSEMTKYVKQNPVVAELRMVGLFCGVELDPTGYQDLPDFDESHFGDEVTMMMLGKGFIVRNGGPRFIIAPPLIAELEELSALAKAFGEALGDFHQMWEAKRGAS